MSCKGFHGRWRKLGPSKAATQLRATAAEKRAGRASLSVRSHSSELKVLDKGWREGPGNHRTHKGGQKLRKTDLGKQCGC